MAEFVFKARPRSIVGKQVKALRRQGLLPAVLYGRNFNPIPVVLDYREASRVLPHITSSQLVVIDLDGKQHHALVREKQRHPVMGSLLHVDFNVVSMTEKLRAFVSLHLVGESPAVEEFNGILVSGVEELEVECLPADLPDHINVDISALKHIGDAIHVRDVVLSDKIEVLTDPDEIVAVVTGPEGEEEVVSVEEGVEPEVIERGKKKEEEF